MSTQLASVDKSGDRVRQMFGQIARRYDLLNHLLSLNIDQSWRYDTVRKVPASGGDPILDVCTGTGDLAFAYWQSTRGGVPIVAADFCPEMLAVAREKQRRRNIPGIDFLEANTADLPFDSDRFQIVSVAFGLRNVENTERGMEEMIRVCRPGGRVAILEFSQPTVQPLKGIYNLYFQHLLPRIGQRLANNDQSAYRYLPASVGEFPHGQALADQLASKGLREVRFYPLTFGISTLYVGVK